MQSPRLAITSLRQQRDVGGTQELELAHQSVTAAESAGPAGTTPQLVAKNAQGIVPLETLDRRIQRIGHVRVDTR